MTKSLVVSSKEEKNHSNRLVNGLRACGMSVGEVKVPTKAIFEFSFPQLDYIFVEASTDSDLSCLTESTDKVILFDVEDRPYFFNPKEGYHSLKDKALAYIKYNYQDKYPNPDGLKHIAAPQVNYLQGAELARQIYPHKDRFPETGDIFFIGTPTYLTNYEPIEGAGYVSDGNINSIAQRPIEMLERYEQTTWIYNQRLEWIYLLSKSPDIRFTGGLKFESGPNATIQLSIDLQSRVFGDGCRNLMMGNLDYNQYYREWMARPISLSPAGMARSSYRIIELMALGRIILGTDTKDYKYLYNPKSYTVVPDGGDIVGAAVRALDNKEELLEAARENVEVFSRITPDTMLQDFLSQIP